MTTQQTPNNSSAGESMERWVKYERQIGTGLLIVGLLLLAIPITNVAKYRFNSLAFLVWGAALSMFVLGMGVYTLMPSTTSPEGLSRAERLRWIFLLTTGGIGAMTAVLGLVLPFCVQPLAQTNYQEIFMGGPKAWRSNGWAVARCLMALIGGLILMFVGVQLARPVQRTSMSMRRWLYGYNTILSGLLLLFILILVNLLPYTDVKPFSYAKAATDWTATQIYTLQPATKNALSELKEPFKVYVLIPRSNAAQDILNRDVVNLMNSCRNVNPLFSWEQLSRDRNREEVAQLVQKYQLPEMIGLLAVYGPPTKETTRFIKLEDLLESSSSRDRQAAYAFKGENALLDALIYLTSGQTRATVYFTQGSGEPDLEDRDKGQFDAGMGILNDELAKNNYQTKSLRLTVQTTSIPDDADIVVVARPQVQLPANAVKALSDYMNGTGRKDGKKGKMIALFDVTIRQGEMVQTGLEPLMAQFGVKVNADRVLVFSKNPLRVLALTDPRSNNPIVRAFLSQGTWTATFKLYDARTITPAPVNPPGRFTVENLLISMPQMPCWVEKDLKASPSALVTQMRQSDSDKLGEKLTHQLPLAVTVTEGKAPSPVPGHDFMSKDGEPRLIVFGDASWATNNIMLDATPDNYSLFSSCLSWLAGRHDIGKRIPSAERKVYRLEVAPGDEKRLTVLPGILLLFGVVSLGFGVWVVRRR